MTERQLFLPATPEDAGRIVRSGVLLGSGEVELAHRRQGCPGGTAVGVLVDDDALRASPSPGRVLAPRDLVEAGLQRAFQPWHIDVEPDPRARWRGYVMDVDGSTLRNLLGIEGMTWLRDAEARYVEARRADLDAHPVAPTRDLDELKAIHDRLFQDVYPWAGETRTVNMGRGGESFAPWDEIEGRWAEISDGLRQANGFTGLDRPEFVDGLTELYNDVNSAHAFREGNGRTQRQFLASVADDAGFHLNWQAVLGPANDMASVAARSGDLRPLRALMETAVTEPTAASPQPSVASPERTQRRQAPSRSRAMDRRRMDRARRPGAGDSRPPRM